MELETCFMKLKIFNFVKHVSSSIDSCIKDVSSFIQESMELETCFMKLKIFNFVKHVSSSIDSCIKDVS